MLHLIPAPLHRQAYRIVHAVRTRWWRIRKTEITGARVLALNADAGVLLVRHSYGSRRWMLPGGGLERGEHPLAAAVRELREETACALSDATLIEVSDQIIGGGLHRVYLVAGRSSGTPVPDGREITEARFFCPEDLPQDLARVLQEHLSRWLTAASAAGLP